MIFKKIAKKEQQFTEKFALLNLLQALQTLSSKAAPDGEEKDNGAAGETSAPAPPKPTTEDAPRPNVMANVLERHEAIANRLRNKK